jgi:hypothetical protein
VFNYSARSSFRRMEARATAAWSTTSCLTMGSSCNTSCPVAIILCPIHSHSSVSKSRLSETVSFSNFLNRCNKRLVQSKLVSLSPEFASYCSGRGRLLLCSALVLCSCCSFLKKSFVNVIDCTCPAIQAYYVMARNRGRSVGSLTYTAGRKYSLPMSVHC